MYQSVVEVRSSSLRHIVDDFHDTPLMEAMLNTTPARSNIFSASLKQMFGRRSEMEEHLIQAPPPPQSLVQK